MDDGNCHHCDKCCKRLKGYKLTLAALQIAARAAATALILLFS